MSMGYGGYANLKLHDETLVVYSYCCYDLNSEGCHSSTETEDGELYIGRNAFMEPEIHEKIKKTASGKKKVEAKRAIRQVPLRELFDAGKIKVKNASGTWTMTDTGIDLMAIRILSKIFDEYQKTGKLPVHINWFS